MEIKKAAFVTSLDAARDFPGRGAPEIAVAGKSNVGKSSLINRLANNGKLARTSAEPGKTRLLNVYAMNGGAFLLVDLPGYGYAKTSKDEQERWAAMIEGYLTGSGHISHVLQLVDMRHEPTRQDVMMVDYLRHYALPFTVVATKADKLSRAKRAEAVRLIGRALTVQPWQILPFSSEDGTGLEALMDVFDGAVANTTE